jgi:multiple sugar transport system substrate-binding protein
MKLPTHRWRWSASIAAAAALLVSTACSSGSHPTAAASTSLQPGQKINLTFWSWVPGVDAAVAQWNTTHPDIHVTLEKIPSGSSGGYAKMFSALKANSAPDLAQVEYQEIPGFLLQKGLVDLSKYGANDAKAKFVDWQWQQGVFGDGVYAVPQASGPMAMFYRADLFDKLGLTPPTTWAEYEADAKKIHAADPHSYISTFPPGNSAWFTSMAQQAGAKWFDAKGDNWVVNIDNPQTQQVAAYWDRLVREKVIKTEPDFANGWYKDLQDGHIAAWVSAQWGDAILSGNAPGTAGKWRVAPMPQWNAGEHASANWGGSSTAVLTGAKYPKQAAEFAVWLNSDPQSVALLIKGGYGWPAATDAFKGTTLDQPSAFFGGQKYNDVFAAADQNIDKSWKWIPTVDAAYQHLNDGFSTAISGSGSFGGAVTKAQQQTVDDMKAKGLSVTTGP